MNFVLTKNQNGDFVGLDRDSGGYPYITNNLNQVKFWSSLKEVKEYQQMFKKENYKIQMFGFTLMEVKED